MSAGIISADDHLIEPPDLWTARLPRRLREVGPRLVRQRGRAVPGAGELTFELTADGDWADIWHFDSHRVVLSQNAVAVGFDRDELSYRPVTYDEIRPGCYRQAERLADMDRAGIDASLCFPNTFVRFCGQRFFETDDRELGLLCVRAYNDFQVDEWAAGSGGRLIPCAIVPLWDPDLAAAEIRRVAARGCRAVAFSEVPAYLGLPSIHGAHWDPFFAACNETGTAIMLHIGSSSRLTTTSDDAPPAVLQALLSNNSASALADWLCSGKLIEYPDLKVCLAESNIGWIPYYLERLDWSWDHNRAYTGIADKLAEPPSHYYFRNFFVSFFSDAFGISNLDAIGEDNVVFESDYPHADSTWPDCLAVVDRQLAHLSDPVRTKLLRGNAARLLGLT